MIGLESLTWIPTQKPLRFCLPSSLRHQDE
jgi:hypothetical protein